jgi:predicted RecA/RadA family phage recombinase
MAKNFIQEGKVLDVTVPSDVKSGGLVVILALVGVALTDISKDDTGSVQVEGVFGLPTKVSFNVGEKIFVDNAGLLTKTATNNTIVGITTQATTGEMVAVKLG